MLDPTRLPTSKDAFTLDELVELGDGSRSFLYEQISAGKLTARKRGRRTIVMAADREAWRASWPPIKPKNAA